MSYLPLSGKHFAAVGMVMLLASVALIPANAATSTTPIVGYVRTEILPKSDLFSAASLSRNPVYIDTVASAAVNTITVTGNPGWSAAQFLPAGDAQPDTYYARIGATASGDDNPFEGREFKIEIAGGNTLVVTDPINGDLSTIPVGARIEIIPYWTLGTLFLPEDTDDTTEIFIPDHSAVGTNCLPVDNYYVAGNSWRKTDENITDDFTHTPIEGAAVFKVRNTSSVALEFSVVGNVRIDAISQPLRTQITTQQDNWVSTGRPVPVALKDLELVESGGFVVTAGVSRQDMLLIYPANAVGYNNSASEIYFYQNGVWRRSGQNFATDFGDVLISPDATFIIRKKATIAGDAAIWTSTRFD